MGTPVYKVRTPIAATALRQGTDGRTARLEDDGRRWAPRSALLLGGAVSLAVWGAIIAAAVR
jgi:hypothetical protein